MFNWLPTLGEGVSRAVVDRGLPGDTAGKESMLRHAQPSRRIAKSCWCAVLSVKGTARLEREFMRWLLAFCAILFASEMMSTQAYAQKRVALVIGMSDYLK